MGKLNSDGHNDVVLCMQHNGVEGHGGIVVQLGKGDGTFYDNAKSPKNFYVEPLGQCRHPKPCWAQIADMNDDNQNDIVTSNGDDHTLSVLINKSLIPEDN
jgi:hypothetical protein